MYVVARLEFVEGKTNEVSRRIAKREGGAIEAEEIGVDLRSE